MPFATIRPPAPARALPRVPALTAALVAVSAAALLLSGCSATVPGSAAAGSGTTSPPGTAPSSPAEPDDDSATGSPPVPDGGCAVTIGGRGNIRISGASNRAVTTNGATSFSCGNGPLLAIDEVADGGVTFSVESGRPVRVAAGETATVGDYEITVGTASGDSAEFVVAPPG